LALDAVAQKWVCLLHLHIKMAGEVEAFLYFKPYMPCGAKPWASGAFFYSKRRGRRVLAET